MKKTLLLLFIIIVSSTLIAQNNRTKPFKLVMPKVVVENSLYNKIKFLDSRLFKENMGYIQTGMFNNYAYMVDEPAFADQLDSLMNHIIDNTAQEKTLLVQLRNLNFSEITKSTSETGYCHIRMSLYEENYPDYYLISTLDTLLQVKAMDVTSKLLQNSSSIITSFISDNITKIRSDERPFMFADIHNIDFFEKNDLKAYSADTYKNGVYLNSTSFFNQVPEKESFVPEFDELNNLKSVKVNDSPKGKPKKINPKELFAVVVDGQLYVTSDKNYIPVYKDEEDNEFRFIGYGNVKINAAGYIGGAIGAGFVAALFGVGFIITPAMDNTSEKIEMTIDHISGNFVILPRESDLNKEQQSGN